MSKELFTTKVTGLWGWIMAGKTKVSSVLMWLPMKTQGDLSSVNAERFSNERETPTRSKALIISRLARTQAWSEDFPSFASLLAKYAILAIEG